MRSRRPVGWRQLRIGDLGQVIPGITPPSKDARNFGSAYPFITIQDLYDHRWIEHSNRSLSEQGARSCGSRRQLPRGTVLISGTGVVGETGLVARPSFTNQQIFAIRPDLSLADPVFLYYSLCALRRKLEDLGSGGSVNPHVSKANFCEVKIPLPPLPEQRRIAGVLGAIDNLLESNRGTLSEIRDTLLPRLIAGDLEIATRYDPAAVLATLDDPQ